MFDNYYKQAKLRKVFQATLQICVDSGVTALSKKPHYLMQWNTSLWEKSLFFYGCSSWPSDLFQELREVPACQRRTQKKTSFVEGAHILAQRAMISRDPPKKSKALSISWLIGDLYLFFPPPPRSLAASLADAENAFQISNRARPPRATQKICFSNTKRDRGRRRRSFSASIPVIGSKKKKQTERKNKDSTKIFRDFVCVRYIIAAINVAYLSPSPELMGHTLWKKKNHPVTVW